MNILLLGPPGSGKGTVAAQLVSDFGYVHLSTGNMFRDEIAKQTPIGKEVKHLLDSGVLVPDELTIRMVKSKIVKGKDYIFDGFPRTIPQADAFPLIDQVIYFDIPREEVVKRFADRRMGDNGTIYSMALNPPPKGVKVIFREDDKPEVVTKRFVEYQEKTQPLVDYYKKKKILLKIDAVKAPDIVYAQVKKVLGKK
ncbi:nucleoside monophosphate kinase [Candidatus Woesearchaeota archaeon]|nr:nucleoside monophosphate kinase [Candidatus Woesearchaeota archaeon]